MHAVIVVPTYWSREKKQGWKEGDTIYDHPTPLDQKGTLKRFLESVRIIHPSDAELVIIAVPTAQEIEEKVETKVKQIVSSVSLNIPITIIGPTQIHALKKYFLLQGHQEMTSLISNRGYGHVRNLCLLFSSLYNADVAILIDDDEVFEDPTFFSKAMEYMKTPIKNTLSYGIAGYYVQENGEYQLSQPEYPWAKYWNKQEKMNEGFKQIIGSKPRIKETPFVFGGNMIIPKDLYTHILFDPNIPRGEDIDYLINARMFGFTFYLDNQLAITHLPPPKSHPLWQRIREDMYRFLYERAKILNQKKTPGMHALAPEAFDPYPGCFLKNDLEEKLRKTNTILSQEYEKTNDNQAKKQALQNISLMEKYKKSLTNPFENYLQLQAIWEKLMKSIADTSVKNEIKQHLFQESIKKSF